MRYQYKREPPTGDEATRLANACNSHEEKLVVWTLLDTGLRVSELANLKRANLDWQTHRLMIYGKGGPFGSKSNRRVIPLSAHIQPIFEGYFALHETFRFSTRTIQRMEILSNVVDGAGQAARCSISSPSLNFFPSKTWTISSEPLSLRQRASA